MPDSFLDATSTTSNAPASAEGASWPRLVHVYLSHDAESAQIRARLLSG